MNKTTVASLSILDLVRAYSNYILNYYYSFCRYKERYKNFIEVAFHVLRNEYPIKAELRNGKQKHFSSQIEIWLDTKWT